MSDVPQETAERCTLFRPVRDGSGKVRLLQLTPCGHMDSQHAPDSDLREEWSVVLDGRYVVTFRGPRAQEHATRQMHELADLLGFEVSLTTDVTTARAAALSVEQ